MQSDLSLTMIEQACLEKFATLLKGWPLAERKRFMFEIIHETKPEKQFLPLLPMQRKNAIAFWQMVYSATLCFTKMPKAQLIAFMAHVIQPRTSQEVQELSALQCDTTTVQKAIVARHLSQQLTDIYCANAQQRFRSEG